MGPVLPVAGFLVVGYMDHDAPPSGRVSGLPSGHVSGLRGASARMAYCGPTRPFPPCSDARRESQLGSLLLLFQRVTAKLWEARKSVVSGKDVSVSVDLGGRRIIKKKQKHNTKRSQT